MLTGSGFLTPIELQPLSAITTITFTKAAWLAIPTTRAQHVQMPARVISGAQISRTQLDLSSDPNLSKASLQAYAYCGCYFNLPDDIYECANVQLEIVGDVEPTSSVSLLPFTGTITTTLGTSPIGPMISVAPNPKGASVLAFGGAPAVLTTTVTISSVYTTTVGGSPSLVTGVTTSAGLTTSYPGSSPTFLPPPQSTKGGPAGGTLTIVTTFPTTEVYTTTSEGSTYPVTTVVEATKTILSCAGGCQATTGASATETVCVRRKQTRVFRRDEI